MCGACPRCALVLASLKELDIAQRSEENKAGVGDAEILGLLAKMIKQREESAAAYDPARGPNWRRPSARKSRSSANIMPKQLSDTEVKAAATKAIAELGAASMKDMGKVMAALKERFAGQMDFGRASALVKELLSAPK